MRACTVNTLVELHKLVDAEIHSTCKGKWMPITIQCYLFTNIISVQFLFCATSFIKFNNLKVVA